MGNRKAKVFPLAVRETSSGSEGVEDPAFQIGISVLVPDERPRVRTTQNLDSADGTKRSFKSLRFVPDEHESA